MGSVDRSLAAGILAHLPGLYPAGGLLVNGNQQDGNLLFRLVDTATRGEAHADATMGTVQCSS